MANQNDNENETHKVAVGIRLESDVHAAVSQVMTADNRNSVANTVETLLKTHPRIKRLVAAQAEVAGAGA